jgi:hypothetical protein
MDDLFNIEPTAPRWRELADMHGITAVCRIDVLDCSKDLIEWTAQIDWFESIVIERGMTEREAVVSLIHRLKLTGWETVSI